MHSTCPDFQWNATIVFPLTLNSQYSNICFSSVWSAKKAKLRHRCCQSTLNHLLLMPLLCPFQRLSCRPHAVQEASLESHPPSPILHITTNHILTAPVQLSVISIFPSPVCGNHVLYWHMSSQVLQFDWLRFCPWSQTHLLAKWTSFLSLILCLQLLSTSWTYTTTLISRSLTLRKFVIWSTSKINIDIWLISQPRKSNICFLPPLNVICCFCLSFVTVMEELLCCILAWTTDAISWNVVGLY